MVRLFLSHMCHTAFNDFIPLSRYALRLLFFSTSPAPNLVTLSSYSSTEEVNQKFKEVCFLPFAYSNHHSAIKLDIRSSERQQQARHVLWSIRREDRQSEPGGETPFPLLSYCHLQWIKSCRLMIKRAVGTSFQMVCFGWRMLASFSRTYPTCVSDTHPLHQPLIRRTKKIKHYLNSRYCRFF